LLKNVQPFQTNQKLDSALNEILSTHTAFARTPWFGGGERDRTDDPLLAKQVLSQLSYIPQMTSQATFIETLQTGGGSGWIRTNDPRLIKTVL
jgi:hypothetical protein